MLPLLGMAAVALPPTTVGAGVHRERLADGSSLVELEVDPRAYAVRPVIAPRLERTSQQLNETVPAATSFAVNGGFFNHRDGVGASYLTIDGIVRSDPHDNALLVGNPKLKPYLTRIFNRTEFRVLTGAEGERWALAPHDAPAPPGFRVLHALQAGPRLLPRLGLESEGFVAYGPAHRTVIRDGIGALQPACRTAIGLKPNGCLVLVVVVGPAGSGLTIPALREQMQRFGCQEAMALDGGSSTTMALPAPPADRLLAQQIIAPPEGEAKVKSALVVYER